MAPKAVPRFPGGRITASLLCLLALFFSACAAFGRSDGRLVEAQVSDCVQLRRAVAGVEAPPDVIELAGAIECDEGEWEGELRLERDLLVVGGNGSGVDWRPGAGVWVVAAGVVVRFEGTRFLADEVGMGSRLPFVRPEEGAVVSLAGVVVGARCCAGDHDQDGPGCASGQGSGAPNGSVGEIAVIGSSNDGAWRVCNSRAACGFKSLEELGGGRNGSDVVDAGCGEDVLGLLFAEEAQVKRASGGGAAATTASMVVVTLVVVVATGALACLWYRRRKARASVLEFKDTQITKMGPVLAVPSMSSFSGSHQGLIQGSPTTVRSSEQPTPFQEEAKPPMVMTNIDVSGIRLSIPIGKGAFATVYKASWVGKTVAVKILQHPPDQKMLPEKSLFEVQLGFTVMHANLVHTLGTQTKKCQDLGMITPRSSRPSSTSLDKPMSFAEDFTRGQSRASSDCFSDMADVLKAQGKEEYETWIVMEYCDQGTLQGAIQRGAFFDNAEKTNLRLVDILLAALDIARGMEHLHAMSIVHGDLKPRNVLMKTKKGDVRGYICKVGDFGFSRSVPDSHLTTATCGAVNYMPPELLAQGILTPSADVYSFGVLLWELLVGGNPYPAKTHNEIIVLVTSGKRPNVPARVPGPCADLIKKCWHQSCEARPTFTEISTTLKELLADPSMEWRPWRPPTSRGRPPRSASQIVMGFSFENPLAPPAPLPSPLSSSVVSPLASPLASQGENPLLSPIRSSVASSIIGPLPSPLPSPVASSAASFMATSNPTTYRSETSDLPPPAPAPKGRPSGKDPLSPLQDFPPTPQDVQSGATMACVTSDSMKNLFLKDLEMSAGQGILPQFDDLLATVKICQRPRIPTGKKAGAVEGSEGSKQPRQKPPVPRSVRKE